MRRWMAVLGIAVATACGDATAPVSNGSLYADAVVIPRTYSDGAISATWRHMQECSGLEGEISFESITFYSIPRDFFHYESRADTGSAYGLWVPARKQIYVAHLDAISHSAQPIRTLRHEMLHALLHPVHGHPSEWFATGPCGNLTTDGEGIEHYR